MKVLIVDDEKPARDRLRQLLEDAGEHEIVGEASHGQEALDIAAGVGPDVVLLDIRMPGVDGIETAHHLNKFALPPAIVFTTAYDEYAIDAFEANAIGYVLKPVRRGTSLHSFSIPQKNAASPAAPYCRTLANPPF